MGGGSPSRKPAKKSHFEITIGTKVFIESEVAKYYFTFKQAVFVEKKSGRRGRGKNEKEKSEKKIVPL